ncbi:hypothetical protein D3C81_918850 [compost metagenome]
MADADWRAIDTGDDDIGDVLGRRHLAWRANQQLLAIALDVAGADVGVVAFQRRDQVVEGEFVGRQALGLRRNQVLLGMAADAVDLGHPGHVAQLRLDDPVLDHPQVGRGVGRAVFLQRALLGFHRPQEDFTQPGGNRPHARFDAVGQLLTRHLQALVDQLAGEEQVGAVIENDRDLRQARARQRAGLLEPGQAGHGGLDGEGDALLGLQRRIAGRGGVDLHLDVGDVRYSVDRQFLVAVDTHRGHQDHGQHHHQALLDGELDQAFEHAGVPVINGCARPSLCPART